MRFEMGMGKVKVTSGDKTFVAAQDSFAASCERLAAQEVEEQAAVLPDSQLTDEDFRRAVLARVSPEVRRRLAVSRQIADRPRSQNMREKLPILRVVRR